MSVTVSAEFESVDFAERAARRIRMNFPDSGTAVITCRQMADAPENQRVPVSVLNSFSTNFQTVAYTSTPMFSGKDASIYAEEPERRKSASLAIKTEAPQAGSIAGMLTSCGGYDTRKV